MERTIPTSEPGAVGSGVEGAGAPSAASPKATGIDSITVSNLYAAKCQAAARALPELLPRVWAYCEKHIAAGRTWHWCYPIKLLELSNMLSRFRPTSICELGTGCTTAVFAEYCFANAVDFLAVDENAEWQAAVLQDIGYEVNAAIHKAEWAESAVAYDGLDITHEFIYVDGPSNRIGNANECAICVDAWIPMKRKSPAVVAFDIRRETVRFLREETLGYDWELSVWSAPHEPWFLSSLRHHTVARRKP